MEKLFLFIFFFVLFSLVFRLTLPYILKNSRRKISFAILWSLVLASFVLFFNQYMPFRFSTEKDIIKYASKSNNQFSELIEYSQKNFTLVDVSFAKRETEHLDSCYKDFITDRNKLTLFLRKLNNHPKLYSKVVVDISFNDVTPFDTALHNELYKLKEANKLIIGVEDQSFLEENEIVYKGLDSTFANITDFAIEDNYFVHTVFKTDSKGVIQSSLAHQINYHLQDIEFSKLTSNILNIYEDNYSDGRHSYAFNNFIPPLYKDNETTSFIEEVGKVFTADRIATEQGSIQMAPMEFQTHYLTEQTEPCSIVNDELVAEMEANMNSSMRDGKNIVFIGDFSKVDISDDLHTTPVGEMLGTEIILNIAFQLSRNYNQGILWRFTILLLVFFIVSTLMLFDLGSYITGRLKIAFNFVKSIRVNIVGKQFHRSFVFSSILKRLTESKIFKLTYEIIKFLIFEEKHYWLLMIFFLVFFKTDGYILSIMPLFMAWVLLEIHLKIYENKN